MYSPTDSPGPSDPNTDDDSWPEKPRRKRRSIRVIDFVVAFGVALLMIALFLGFVIRSRVKADRVTCARNLGQLGGAAFGYHATHLSLPPGISPQPFQASAHVHLLPYLGQPARYAQFDQTMPIGSIVNYYGRVGDVPELLCPADPSVGAVVDSSPPAGVAPGNVGRSSYYGNAGSHAMATESFGAFVKPVSLAGIFSQNSQTRHADITDGLSNTALFAEIKRGAAPANDALNVTLNPAWGSPAQAPTNPNNFPDPITRRLPAAFLTACNNPTIPSRLNSTGLKYYDGSPTSALYTHTLPPNYQGRDCMSFPLPMQFHLAARSHHLDGVNVCLCDGSVRFVMSDIDMFVWTAMGTRSGSD